MSLSLILPAVLFALALSADANASAAAQPPGDACSYLSAQTASSLYGAPVSAPNSVGAPGGMMMRCVYGASGVNGAVALTIQTVSPGMEAMVVNMLIKQDPKIHFGPMPGLGDRATYTSGEALSLVVLIHQKLVKVSVTGSDTPGRRAALLAVVQGIVSNFKRTSARNLQPSSNCFTESVLVNALFRELSSCSCQE